MRQGSECIHRGNIEKAAEIRIRLYWTFHGNMNHIDLIPGLLESKCFYIHIQTCAVNASFQIMLLFTESIMWQMDKCPHINTND